MLVTESKTILEVLLAVERLDEVVVVVAGALGSVGRSATLERNLADPQKV